MLIGAKALTVADNAFAPRQMYATMGAAHHILAGCILWRVIPLDSATIAFDEAVNNPGGQSKKYQFDQHHSAPVCEAPQGSRFGHDWSG